MHKLMIVTSLLFAFNLWGQQSTCPQILSQLVDVYQKSMKGADLVISICDQKGDHSQDCIQAQQFFKQLDDSVSSANTIYDNSCPNLKGPNALSIADMIGNYLFKKRKVQMRDKSDNEWWRGVPKNRTQYERLCREVPEECPL